jgi:uncharacterized protein YegL
MSEEVRPIVVDTPVNPNLEIYDYLVIDRSGSMSRGWTNTIQGINTYLEGLRKTQREQGVKTYVSVMFFDDEQLLIYDNCPAIEVRDFDTTTYAPRNGTALNDAIGAAITSMRTKLAGREGAADVDVTISIFTDGDENMSTRYRGRGNTELFGLIDELKNQYGWTFTFTGAGTEEQVRVAAMSFGFDASNVQAYDATDTANFLHTFNNMEQARSVKSSAYYTTGLKSNVGYFTPANSTNTNSTMDMMFNPANPLNITTITTTGDIDIVVEPDSTPTINYTPPDPVVSTPEPSYSSSHDSSGGYGGCDSSYSSGSDSSSSSSSGGDF